MNYQSAAPNGLRVGLGETRYAVERPFGAIESRGGLVSDVACDRRGHVFVLLRFDPLVHDGFPAVIELDPQGECVNTFGAGFIADGHMLAISPDERIFIVDRDAHQIVVLDRAGRQVGEIGQRHCPGEPFCHPSAVAFAPDGTFYVADGYGSSFVHLFDAEGRRMTTWGAPGREAGQFSTPHGIWVAGDRVLVADRENDRVQVFSLAGEWLAEWRDFAQPMDIWSNQHGHIYVSDKVPRVSRLTPDGMLTGRCRPVLNGAHGIAGDSVGNLYLAEVNPSRITRLSPIS